MDNGRLEIARGLEDIEDWGGGVLRVAGEGDVVGRPTFLSHLICRPCGVSISSAAGGDSSRPMRERFDSRKTSSTDDGAGGKWTGLSGISGPWRMTLAQKSCSIGRISSGSVSFSVCILVSPPLFILDHLRNFTS
ncbi:hypothetical protein PNOK_0312500 [Pyrrhoderma noxium]|uniref:Uncharacterized protein n=1 Tax=Pyrrhoderma noxium TaxID=2282107 RepID=A0A286ULP6_9AGAM|nr:hypothetical protein PNOK_0312500 [Pyrrhoderma noxium]